MYRYKQGLKHQKKKKKQHNYIIILYNPILKTSFYTCVFSTLTLYLQEITLTIDHSSIFKFYKEQIQQNFHLLSKVAKSAELN